MSRKRREEERTKEREGKAEREKEDSLGEIGGSTIQDYSLSLREDCERRPSMRSRNIRRGGVRCRATLLRPQLFSSLRSCLSPLPSLPCPVPSRSVPFLPLDTCSRRWIRILLGIQVDLRGYRRSEVRRTVAVTTDCDAPA